MTHQNYFRFLGTFIFLSIFVMNAFGNQSNAEKRVALCELLNEELVIAAFDLPTDIAFDKTDSEKICSYGWTESDTGAFYSVSLNFARGGQREPSSAQVIWENQNKRLYHDKDMRKVADVGDQATWSTLGGGQLRVQFDGYIFYVSLLQYPSGSMETSKAIGKTSAIAKAVIANL